MQLYMSWYTRSFFGFTFLNCLYFFKYSCTNIFHRRSRFTFYFYRSSIESARQNIGWQSEGRYLVMQNDTHFIWIKASQQCYCIPYPTTVQKCVGMQLYLIIAHFSPQTSVTNICKIGYDICDFDSLRGIRIDTIGRVHFDNRDKIFISMSSIGKVTKPCISTNNQVADFWQFR